ncbi:MAG: T9SS type A sorting domain-containing protein [Paludibacteraceae bacterium]|nr:T9SS type A sorting domain-containing protein [Paludibacteraceae bacterium]
MKHLLLLLALMLNTVAFAFESEESAINFAWDYAKKNIKTGEYGYRVGIVMSEIDTIINIHDIMLSPEKHEVTYDTIIVPKGYYVIGIDRNQMYEGAECQPYTLLYASKKDSTYIIEETCGNFMNDSICYKPYRKMFTRQEAIDTMMANLDSYVGSSNCNVYIYEENKDSSFTKLYWQFLIESKTDTILAYYLKDLMFDSVFNLNVKENVIFNIDDYNLIFSRQNGDVDEYGSVKEYMVYPNPVVDVINVDIDNCSLSLFSNEGKLIKKSGKSRMDISELPSGVYLLEISREGKSVVKKIIKD